MRALLLVLIATAVVPTAWASECFSIQDADQRNACLASAKSDKSYCFKIRDADLREGDLAPLQGETYGCFKIQDPDARAACLGETKDETWDCFTIQNVDQRNACLGSVKTDRSYCFKIQNKNLRNDCLANTPRRDRFLAIQGPRKHLTPVQNDYGDWLHGRSSVGRATLPRNGECLALS